MEEKGWIYQLPEGAAELHPSASSWVGDAEEVKRREEGPQNEFAETKEVKREKKAGTVGPRILSGKPFAKEVLAVHRSIRTRTMLMIGHQDLA